MLIKNLQRDRYFDDEGNFNLAAYIYDTQKDLMKFVLDQGNLAVNDTHRRRSFKERIKKEFNDFWLELAGILEAMEVIELCGCPPKSHCDICGGSRYRLGRLLTPEEVREVFSFVEGKEDDELRRKLLEKLPEAERLLYYPAGGGTIVEDDGE